MDFHWLPVLQRSLNSICILVDIYYDSTGLHALQCLCNLIVPHSYDSNARELRSNNKRLIKTGQYKYIYSLLNFFTC